MKPNIMSLIVGVVAICSGIGLLLWAITADFVNAFLIVWDILTMACGIVNLLIYFKLHRQAPEIKQGKG